MRPLLYAAALLLTALTSTAAVAGEPVDPFAAAPAAAPTASATPTLALIDPFSAPSASKRAAEHLEDPFSAVPAPRCPVQVSRGVVVQRPAGAPCPEQPEPLGLIDPFGA